MKFAANANKLPTMMYNDYIVMKVPEDVKLEGSSKSDNDVD